MILPRDHVTPAQRLGKPFGGHAYDERHFMFQRHPQSFDPIGGEPMTVKIFILGYLLVLLATLVWD